MNDSRIPLISTTLADVMPPSRKSSRYLARASLAAFGHMFFAPVLPRIIQLAATFAQPLLVNKLVGFISDPERSAQVGWALVGAVICVYGLLVISTSLYLEEVR
jgi:ATP-binding cassette, subfamily C (CFTR/MRP), member 1